MKYNESQVTNYIKRTMENIAIPEYLREDVIQEARVAALEGRDVQKAIRKFIKQESDYITHKQSSL